ncbi:MAG TPA: heme exporter protein CcmD [Burkholderiales bacterium]|nr:heme exporter protein CcmD [Burkholderiales bacterium]
MNWGSAAEFFAMGGYAPYVWGSYGVVALCMIIEPVAARARHRAAAARLKALEGAARRTASEAAA